MSPRLPSACRCLVLLSALLLSACASAGKSWVEIGGERYQVEIADEEPERERGLMFRDSMEAGNGMLFIHDRQEPLAYWMKNTRIPLDILYFDNAKTLVAQQRNVPPCSAGNACPSYPSNVPARFVLELNAGEATRLKLEKGAVLTLDKGITVPPAQ